MYKGMKGRVLVGPGMSEEFSLNIGLRQGSMGNMLCGDNLAVVVESGRR